MFLFFYDFEIAKRVNFICWTEMTYTFSTVVCLQNRIKITVYMSTACCIDNNGKKFKSKIQKYAPDKKFRCCHAFKLKSQLKFLKILKKSNTFYIH